MSVAVATTTTTTATTNSNEMPPKDEPSITGIDYNCRGSVESLLTMQSEDHNYRMKDEDLSELRKLAGNSTCIDCGEADPIWASVNLGIFVCLSCSGKHRALGTHVSFVRSVQMDSWSDLQLKKMYTGGNDQCAQFLKKHGVAADSSLVEKYDTPAAHLYQQVLAARINGEPEPTELPTLPKKKKSVQMSNLKLDGFGSSPPSGQQQQQRQRQQRQQKGGLFAKFRSMSMNDDETNTNTRRRIGELPGRPSGSSLTGTNIGELPSKPQSAPTSGELPDHAKEKILAKLGFSSISSSSLGDLTEIELSQRSSTSERQDSGMLLHDEEEEKAEEEDEVDEFNIDDIVNQIVEDHENSRWSKAQKEAVTAELEEAHKPMNENNEEQNIFHRLSRSSWFGGGGQGNKQVDKLEEEIKKSEHDDIKSILEDDTVVTVATSQSPSSPSQSPGDDDQSPPSGGFIRKVISRTISGTAQRRDTREADAALDRFMDDL